MGLGLSFFVQPCTHKLKFNCFPFRHRHYWIVDPICVKVMALGHSDLLIQLSRSRGSRPTFLLSQKQFKLSWIECEPSQNVVSLLSYNHLLHNKNNMNHIYFAPFRGKLRLALGNIWWTSRFMMETFNYYLKMKNTLNISKLGTEIKDTYFSNRKSCNHLCLSS